MSLGLRPDAPEVEVEPLQEVVGPVPPQRVREGLGPPSARERLVAPVAVGVVVGPLAVEPLDVEAGVDGHLVGREGHVRVDVPVLEPVDDVDRPFESLERVREEVALLPVVGSGPAEVVPGHVGGRPGVVALDVALARVLDVAGVTVEAERAVDAVVHDRAPGLHAAVPPHEVVHAYEPGHGDDGGEVLGAGGRGVPWRAPVVRLADGTDPPVGPWLHPQPVDGPLDARLLVVAHEVHAVVRLAGPEDRDLGDPEPVGDEVLDEEPAEAVRGRERVDVPIVVVGAYLGDHGDLAALGHGPSVPVAAVDHGEPQPEVHLRTTGDAGPAIGRVDAGDGDVDGPNLVDLVAPVPRDPGEDVGVVVEHAAPLLDGREPVVHVTVGGCGVIAEAPRERR